VKIDKEQEIRLLCESLNFTYVDSGYNTKIIKNKKEQIYVRFICNAHQKYGIQEKSLMDLRRLKKPCSYCNHSMLKITFKEEMRDVDPTIEILSEYIDTDTKIKCRCLIDGNEWEANPRSLLNGNGCKICGHRKRWDSRGRKTTDDIIREMQAINHNIEIIGEYKGAHKLIECRCKIDGTKWSSYVCNLLNQSAGCPECTTRRIRELESFSQEEFEQRVTNKYPHIEIIGKYINRTTRIKCQCLLHNIEYDVSPRTLLYSSGTGCPECYQSTGERRMIQILKNIGYDIETQHTFADCKHIHVLRFDAYSKKYDIAFEYQGQQHYYPVDFSGDNSIAQREFELCQIRDNIKREYCISNSIHLIEIPYWECDNMESFLCSELDKIGLPIYN
jgi:hypothetical protein